MEINDLVDLLEIDQRVKSNTKAFIHNNPQIAAGETVQCMKLDELMDTIRSDRTAKNPSRKIMILDSF